MSMIIMAYYSLQRNFDLLATQHFITTIAVLIVITKLPKIAFKHESESIGRSVVSNSLQPPWNVAHPAALSMQFSRQKSWSG